jgi:hypothetical protein
MPGEALASFLSGHAADLTAGLFILAWGFVLGLAVACLIVTMSVRPKSRPDAPWRTAGEVFWSRLRSLRGPAFRHQARWLAIRGTDPNQVQAVLQLHHPTLCSWEQGLHAVRGERLFIAPPVNGWILVMGPVLPDPADDVDACFCFILELSRRLGHVQYFSFDRSAKSHAWAAASGGTILRAYAWAGKTLWNQGQMTRDELTLGVRCQDYAADAARRPAGRVDPFRMNTERVPLLAARWSLNPIAIDFRLRRAGYGIVGRLAMLKIH